MYYKPLPNLTWANEFIQTFIPLLQALSESVKSNAQLCAGLKV